MRSSRLYRSWQKKREKPECVNVRCSEGKNMPSHAFSNTARQDNIMCKLRVRDRSFPFFHKINKFKHFQWPKSIHVYWYFQTFFLPKICKLSRVSRSRGNPVNLNYFDSAIKKISLKIYIIDNWTYDRALKLTMTYKTENLHQQYL